VVQEAPLRHLKSFAGAGADAATGPSYLRPSNLQLEAQVRLPKLVPRAGAIAAACPRVNTLWLASWCRRPHCAILNQLLELELMLLLALLTFAPATCSTRPWCACVSLFRELGPLQLLALLVNTLWLAI